MQAKRGLLVSTYKEQRAASSTAALVYCLILQGGVRSPALKLNIRSTRTSKLLQTQTPGSHATPTSHHPRTTTGTTSPHGEP